MDVYRGWCCEARKQNSVGSLGMVDTAVLFSRGESIPYMQLNLSETLAKWNDPTGARARAPGLNQTELRAEVIQWSLPHMVGGKEAMKEVSLSSLLKFLDYPQNQELLNFFKSRDPACLTLEQTNWGRLKLGMILSLMLGMQQLLFLG